MFKNWNPPWVIALVLVVGIGANFSRYALDHPKNEVKAGQVGSCWYSDGRVHTSSFPGFYFCSEGEWVVGKNNHYTLQEGQTATCLSTGSWEVMREPGRHECAGSWTVYKNASTHVFAEEGGPSPEE